MNSTEARQEEAIMRHAFVSGLALLGLVGIGGCVTPQTTVTGVPMDVVIDELKARLNTVHPLVVHYQAETGCTPKGDYAVVAFPTKTVVQLKTVLTDTNTAGIGAQFGTPIVVTPTAQRVASSVKTTQTTVNFCAIPERLKDTNGKAPSADCLWTLKNPNGNYVHSLWPTQVKEVTLKRPEEAQHQKLFTVKASQQPEVTDLADALEAGIGGLAYSQHANACLLPESMDVQLAFEASVDTTAGLKLALVFINIQDTQEHKRDFANTITVTFNLSKGSTPTLLESLF
jgi:hypothetical protein